jgi:CBS domain containing-hemolysin-like protein
MLAGSETHALTTANELALVSGVLAFTARPVREIMTPRTDMVAVPEGMPAGEAAHVFAQSGYSRYPVYRASPDDVVGVVHVFDVLRQQPISVARAGVPPGTTPWRRAARVAIRSPRRGARRVRRHGGVVTFDDLLASLVTELFEGPGAESAERGAGEGVVELAGSAPAADLAERFGVTFGSRDVQTIGGLLAQRLGRIPRGGERFLLAGLEIDVLEASATRVERVAVRRGQARAISLEGGHGA